MCLLSNDVNDYNIVAQGKTSIPGVDDGEEGMLTDVSPELTTGSSHSILTLVSSIEVLLALLTSESALGFRMCMSGILVFTEITMLSNRISDYPLISQGKTRIPGINDAEECDLTIVSLEPAQGACVLMQISVNWVRFRMTRSIPQRKA